MTAWWSGSAVLFDLETDGKDPEDARIIQWCVAPIGPDGARPVTKLAQPERPIPDEAAAVHGISTERAEAEGAPRGDAIVDMLNLLCAASEDVPLIGHNIGSYDLTVVDHEMRRLGIGSLDIERSTFATLGQVLVRVDGRQIGAFWVIDTMVLDKALDPYRKGPPGGGRNKLATVAEFYGVPIRGDAHQADADALAAGRIAWAIARRCSMSPTELHALYADRRRPTELVLAFHYARDLDLPNLHSWQAKQAAEQADGLRDYFRANRDKGDPDTVSGDWPLRPIKEKTA